MITHRMGRLSEGARRLANFLAVARTNFDAEKASKALEVPVEQLAAPWRELEDAGIIEGKWFINDLMAEVLLSLLPRPSEPS
jgi:hypothetical protein